jgi:uncharacterized RmlC-like cupin family protein
MAELPAIPFLPGAISVSHLKVYDQAAPDKSAGGAPHVHLACTEAYYVLAGRGSVQTLNVEGFREIRLETGSLVWFSPGVIHRLINLDGALECLVIAQNAGIADSGDCVLTCWPDLMLDPGIYDENGNEPPSMAALERAYRRRDLAVEGFNLLRTEYQFKGKKVLDQFHSAAGKVVKLKISDWYRRWDKTANEATTASNVHLNNLLRGYVGHLGQGRIGVLDPPDQQTRKSGVCGTLTRYQPEGIEA